MGRPSSYRPEFVAVARKMCEMGATDADLAEAFDVVPSTIWRWQCSIPEFAKAINISKKHADARVERALYQRCLGYTYDAVKIMQYEGTPIKVDYLEHCPPDVAAIKLWLTNRQPDRWAEKQQHKHDAGGGWAEVFDALGKASTATAKAATQ